MSNTLPLKVSAEEVTKISYRYKDSSVPPRFHRSYSITITPKQIHIKIDSYGTILKEETELIKPKVYTSLIESINRAKLVSAVVKSDKDCVGGTHKTLRIKENDVTVYVGEFACCGGTGPIIELHGDVKTVIMVIEAIFPRFQTFLN